MKRLTDNQAIKMDFGGKKLTQTVLYFEQVQVTPTLTTSYRGFSPQSRSAVKDLGSCSKVTTGDENLISAICHCVTAKRDQLSLWNTAPPKGCTGELRDNSSSSKALTAKKRSLPCNWDTCIHLHCLNLSFQIREMGGKAFLPCPQAFSRLLETHWERFKNFICKFL